jgi:hypothetical protein
MPIMPAMATIGARHGRLGFITQADLKQLRNLT